MLSFISTVIDTPMFREWIINNHTPDTGTADPEISQIIINNITISDITRLTTSSAILTLKNIGPKQYQYICIPFSGNTYYTKEVSEEDVKDNIFNSSGWLSNSKAQ